MKNIAIIGSGTWGVALSIHVAKLGNNVKTIGDKPINVSSAYRCQHHNHNVGGVRDSQHVLGKAADIWVEGYSSYYLGGICQEIFDGVGIYIDDDFVHVDMRDDGKSIGKYTWYE